MNKQKVISLALIVGCVIFIFAGILSFFMPRRMEDNKLILADAATSKTYSMSDMGIVSQNEVPEGYIGIYTVSDLDAIRNNLSGRYILMNDIVFTDNSFSASGAYYNNGNGWLAIGTQETPFTGIFDGNGYSIKNIRVNGTFSDTTHYSGVFGYSTGTVNRLGVENGQINIAAASCQSYVGGVVAFNVGSVEQCLSSCSITITASISKSTYATSMSYIGGIVGYGNSGSISDCVNESNLSITQSMIEYSDPTILYAGGIIGYSNATNIVEGINTGNIELNLGTANECEEIKSFVGGIAAYSSGQIKLCKNYGELSAYDVNAMSIPYIYVGGISGYSENNVVDCSNYAKVNAKACYTYAAGISGFATGDIVYCKNSGEIDGTITRTNGGIYSYGYVAGIVGCSSATISECFNLGDIWTFEAYASEAGYAGGICSYISGTIINCFNQGSVFSYSWYGYAGGIAGYADSSSSVSLCYNVAKVSGRRDGAIAGYTANITPNCYYYNDMKGVGTGRDTAISCSYDELLVQSTFEGFDFSSVWMMQTEGICKLPVLQNVNYEYREQNTSEFSGGTGTAWDPYIIKTKENLDNVRLHVGSYYKMEADIIFDANDFSETGAFYNDGIGWEPIEGKWKAAETSRTADFFGSFDGNGHIIKNLYSNTSDNSYTGLFGLVDGDIKNLGIIECNINSVGTGTASNEVGGIVGRSYGTITNCYVLNGTIHNETTGYGGAISGGIVGRNYGLISNCYSVNIEGKLESISNGREGSEGSSVGGIAGYCYLGSIINCYSIFSNLVGDSIGAICGDLSDPVTIENCYYSSDYIQNGVGSGTDTTIACSQKEMQDQVTFAGFDFNDVWTMGGNEDYYYPELISVELLFQKEVVSLEINTYPSKLTYCENEELDLNDGTLCVAYNNGDSEEISFVVAEVQGYDSTVIGEQTLVISYKGGSVNLTVWVQHVESVPVHENEVAATCEEAGSYDEVVYCTVCGEELSREEITVEATGHNWGEWTETKAPTCTEEGEEQRVCANDQSHIETRLVEALGHDLVHHEGQAATCTEKGWEAYDTCSRCDYTTYVEILAKGHVAGEPVHENEVAATCEEAGSYDEVVYCTVCGEELSREEITVEATGHNWGEWTETKAPGCTEAGEEQRVCSNDPSHIETRPVEALGHNLIHHEGQSATCTETGWAEYDTCSRCDYTTYNEIPAKGHTVSEWIVDKPATCEEAGSRHKECTVCHEVLETESISATGHAWGEWTETKAPTYTGEGEETRICSACGETDIRPVVALGLIQKFKDEVASVGKAQSRSEQFDAISASLTTYDSLSEEEKVAVANDYESLVAAIEAYNASAEAANAELNGATEIAIKVLSSAVTIAAVLAGVWFVLKRLF